MFFKEGYIENYDFSLNKFILVNIVDNFLEITLNRNDKKKLSNIIIFDIGYNL